MATHLHKELDRLKKKLFALGSSVEQSVAKGVHSVAERSLELAEEVIKNDEEIDFLEVDIEEDCLKILALHQPVAIDLRFIISTLKINSDLERIGDLAVNIAERSKRLASEKQIPAPFDLSLIADKARNMLRMSLDCLIEMDVAMAHQICLLDEEVDDINRANYESYFVQVKKQPEHIELLARYTSISKHLERIADYATNIAEDVIYMVEGTIVRHEAPQEY